MAILRFFSKFVLYFIYVFRSENTLIRYVRVMHQVLPTLAFETVFEQWPKSGTRDRPIAVIGYPFSTQSHNDSGRHIIGQNHTASECSRMSIRCTRLWLNKSSKCTRLAFKPPDYGRTTRPPAHTHTRTRSGRELAQRHDAGHCLFFRLGALLLSSLSIFFRNCFLWTMKSQLAPLLTRHRSASVQTV